MNKNEPTAEKKSWMIGEILLQEGWVKQQDLETALNLQKAEGRPILLGEILVTHGIISQQVLYRALAVQFGKKFVELKQVKIQPEVLQVVPKYFAQDHCLMPIAVQSDTLLVAVTDPLDVWPLSELERMTGARDTVIVLATHDDIKEAINRHYNTYHPQSSSTV